MLKVVFWNDWFAPSGQIFRKSNPKNPTGAVDVPEEVAGWNSETRKATLLPSSAKVVSVDERKAPPPPKYINPAHVLDPQHVTDVNNRKREEAEAAAASAAQKEADARLGEGARQVKEAVADMKDEGTRVTDPLTRDPVAPEKTDNAPEGETELERAIREASEKRATETTPAGAPKKRRG